MWKISLILVPLLAGCVAINVPGAGTPDGLDTSGRGAPAPLVYAAAGTEIALQNIVDGQTTQTRITVSKPAGLRGAFARPDGTVGAVYPGCWGCGGSVQIEEALYGALWPLETGKQVTFLRTALDGTKARAVIRVAGIETIRTEAGTYRTYRLDGQINALTGPAYQASVRAWWAPDPGWVVRAEGSDSSGRRLTSVVTEIKAP
ncbi:MAG: hypothetical protein AAFV19_00435 [Pseudomonadota bacterium]